MSLWKRLFGSGPQLVQLFPPASRTTEPAGQANDQPRSPHTCIGDLLGLPDSTPPASEGQTKVIAKDFCEVCGRSTIKTLDGHNWCDRCGLSTDPENVNSLVNRLQRATMSAAAVEKLWDLSPDSAPKETAMAHAIRCLRDEIAHHVYYPNPESAVGCLVKLRDARPARRRDFDFWIMQAWCHSVDALAERGYELMNIYGEHGTFLGSAKGAARDVGLRINEIGGFPKMQEMANAIQFLYGSVAASELSWAWHEVGGWLA